jgi:hypothetical protein
MPSNSQHKPHTTHVRAASNDAAPKISKKIQEDKKNTTRMKPTGHMQKNQSKYGAGEGDRTLVSSLGS